MRKAVLIVLLSVLINAAIALLLIREYDRRFAPRFYVIDVDRMASELYEQIRQGKLTAEEADRRAAEVGMAAKEILESHPRAIIFRKKAVIGGCVEEIGR